MDKSQVATSEDEQIHTQVKYADASLKEDVRKYEVPLQAEILKSKLESSRRCAYYCTVKIISDRST